MIGSELFFRVHRGVQMRLRNLLQSAALAGVLIGSGLGAAEAQVYDGITYPQLKAILSKTPLGLTEKVTDKGNRYLIIMASGVEVPFIATTVDCESGQDIACEGFSFFYIEPNGPMTQSAMTKFNTQTHFVKATTIPGNVPHSLIQGEYYARGGITDQNILNAGSYFTQVLQTYLAGSGMVTMNPSPSASTLADTAKGPHKEPVVDENFIDALVGKPN